MGTHSPGEAPELGYGFDSGYSGLVFTISLTRDGVNIGVFRGASLDDPAGLLDGTGKVHRHVKIRRESDLGDDVRDLLRRVLDRRQVGPDVRRDTSWQQQASSPGTHRYSRR